MADTVPVARPVRGAADARTAAVGKGVLRFVYLWWFLIVLEPDWFLGAVTGAPFYRIPVLLFPFLLWVVFRYAKPQAIDWPFALFVLLHVLGLFYALNRGYTLAALKTLVVFYAVSVAIAAVATTPARIATLLKIYLLGFIWFCLQGLPNQGVIWWHPLLGNQDSYGPLMGIAVGFAFNYAAALRPGRWRRVAYATALFGCAGVVVSFARGAVLSFLLVLGLIFLRAQHKLRTLAIGFVAIVVTLVAIQLFFPTGEFWEEMKTISEGKDEGTGQVRWVMWEMAVEIWTHHPIWGVGPENFGPAASQLIAYDSTRPTLADPDQLYNAALHNIFVQILCEEGLVGAILFVWMTVDMFVRVRRLRSQEAIAAWRRAGGDLDLRSLAIGLELAMVGFLANGFFYNQLYIHWFWTLITLAFVLTRTVESAPRPARMPRRAPSPTPDRVADPAPPPPRPRRHPLL